MDLKRSLVTIALAAAVSATAIAGPADASPAGGGSYAASVATKPGPTVTFSPGGTTVTLGSRILSTSTAVTELHGTIQLKVVRSNGGAQVYSTTKTVSAKSGTGYWQNLPRSTFKKGIWYRLYAVYTATSGHIEKSSTSYKSFQP